jgi:hypothetical protein
MPLWIILTKCRDVARTRRECAEHRIEPRDHVLLAADHQAIATLQPPHAAAGTDIEIMDAAFLQARRTRDVVLPERVAAVDDGVVLREQAGELRDRLFGDLAGRQHQPHGARRRQPLHQILQGDRRGRSLPSEREAHVEIGVEHHALVARAHQAARDVAAHPPKADDPDLHRSTHHWPSTE